MNGKADISVNFCGLNLENPFLLSSAPPTANGDMIRRGFKAGWAGAVTKTLALQPTKNVRPRFASFRAGKRLMAFENIEQISDKEIDEWLPEIQKIKREYPEKAVVASITAPANPQDWQKLVKKVQSAGPDAFELNLSCPTLVEEGMGSDIGQDDKLTRRVVRWVKEVAEIPVMVKLTPNVTDITFIGEAAKQGGADAITAINTILAFGGVDLDTMKPKPTVNGFSSFGGISGPCVKPIALRCILQLAKKPSLPLSGVGGIMTWKDAVEFMLCGSTTLQIASGVMFQGYGLIEKLKAGLITYLDEKGFATVNDLVRKVLHLICEPGELDFSFRTYYRIDRDKCTRCGLCYSACRDGGFQAIEIDSEGYPVINQKKCDACSLCQHVCPVQCILNTFTGRRTGRHTGR